MKRRIALVLCALMLFGSAQAALIDPASDAWLSGNDEVRFALSGQIKTLTPYGQEAIDAFNAALQHISVNVELVWDDIAVDFCVAGDAVVGLKQATAQTGTVLTTSLLPNRELRSNGSAMNALSGSAESEAAFDLFAALEEVRNCYQALTDAIVPFAEEKKANYSIKNVGTSKWSRVARLTPEQSAQIAPLIADVLGCGMDDAYRGELSQATYQKGFVVALYQTAKGGDDLAVYIKGNMEFADGVRRSVSYQWAFGKAKDGSLIDTYKCVINRAKAPKDDREINASYKRTQSDSKLSVKGECTARILTPDAPTVSTTTTHDLKGTQKGDGRTLTGSVKTVTKTTEGDKTETLTTTVEPNLTLTASEGSGVLSGTTEITRKKGKDTHLSVALTFDKEPAEVFTEAVRMGTLYVVTDDRGAPQSSLAQNRDEVTKPDDFLVGKPPIGYQSHTAPDVYTSIDLDTLSEDVFESLMDEMTQNLAGKLLVAMAKLPPDALALLADNLSDADFAAFLSLAEGL